MENRELIPLVSIIVPVYNVETYIEKCIRSVLNQTLHEIEIILVDDGSTDQSGKICDKYSMDSKVRVLHKRNGGLSDARNAGVQLAKAPYIGFVDSDDYVEPDMFETLYRNIISEHADVSFCGIYDCYASGMKPAYIQTEGKYVVDNEKAIQYVLEGKLASVSAVNKLYKKELLLQTPFPIGKTSEDAHVIIPLLMQTSVVVIDMAPKYYYIHRKGTITTRSFKPSDLSIIEAYDNNRKLISQRYPHLLEAANFRYYWSLFYILDKMLNTKSFGAEGEYKAILETIRKNYLNIIKNHLVGKARKIAVSGLLISPRIYNAFLKMYAKKNKRLFNE